MNRYTIHCTEEQTKKALELGAPIYHRENAYISNSTPHFYIGEFGNYQKGFILYFIPSAEEMIGWLEDNGLLISITALNTPDNPIYNYSINRCEESWNTFSSRKEATIAAIDAALEYLENNEKIKSKNSAV